MRTCNIFFSLFQKVSQINLSINAHLSFWTQTHPKYLLQNTSICRNASLWSVLLEKISSFAVIQIEMSFMCQNKQNNKIILVPSCLWQHITHPSVDFLVDAVLKSSIHQAPYPTSFYTTWKYYQNQIWTRILINKHNRWLENM